jgi:hypothetical protein
VLQTVRYKNLGNSPLYVVWARNDKLLKTKPVRGEKYVYDFTDATGNPPEPAVPLTLPCTMYLKSGKFLPKKSKLYLKYKKASGGSEMDLGVTELNISEHLNPKTPSVPVKETITLQFGKSLDRGSTVTFQLQARWLEGVDVKKLREEDPDAVSRASGVSSAYHAQNADGTSQSRDNPEHVDEPATDDDDEPAASPPVAQPKPRKVLSAPPAEDDQPLEDEDGAVAGVGEMEEYDEDENSQERAARKAAKAAKKAAKAEKKAKKAAKRAAAQDEDGSEEVEDEEDPSASPGMSASASASPAALAYAQSAGLAVASPAAALASPPAKSTSGAPASGAGSARGSLSGPALAATSPAAATIPAASSSSPAGTASASATAAAPPAVDESVEDDEPEADDPSWTNFTGTIPYILSQQQSDAPDLAIPQPLAKLMKAVKKLGGYETEGIFKRQPDAAMVQALRERMESGVYKLKTDDPHIPAFTIKTWLSSLAIPIFPPSVHAVMLRAGSMDDVDEAELERRRREDKERERREQEEEDEEEDAAANAGPNADPRYRKSNKQKELAADLYSDILHPEASSPSHHNAPAGGEQEKKETVKDLVVQVVSSIPGEWSHLASRCGDSPDLCC